MLNIVVVKFVGSLQDAVSMSHFRELIRCLIRDLGCGPVDSVTAH